MAPIVIATLSRHARLRIEIGIESLNVHRGVRLDLLSAVAEVARVLGECHIEVFADGAPRI
jgi:hypothetical protein